MMAGTFVIAVLPTYRTIGVAAPLILVAARLIQGFSAGGEFGSATAILAEHVPGRRGFFASWQVASQGLTTLLAAAFGTVLNAQLTAAQMAAWGWRVPFFFGLLLGPVAYYIRAKVDETPEFLAADVTANPLRDTFASHKARLVAAIGAVVLGTVATYLVLFMPTYGVKQLGLAPSAAFAAILVVGVIQMAFAPESSTSNLPESKAILFRFCQPPSGGSKAAAVGLDPTEQKRMLPAASIARMGALAGLLIGIASISTNLPTCTPPILPGAHVNVSSKE